MKPPSSIKVGPYTFTVEFDEDKCNAKSNEYRCHINGHCQLDELQLLVRPSLAPQRQQVVMLHETLHTVFNLAGVLQDDDVIEEGVVDKIAPVLLQVIQDNIKLVEFLQEEHHD